MEARVGIEPAMRVLQTPALPLGYRARVFAVMSTNLHYKL